MCTQRRVRKVATVAFVIGLFSAGTAGAQAPLGFTIDPTQGLPGTVVSGQVDVTDVAESCVTDLTEFQARFAALLEGPFASGATEGELFSRFFPGGDFVFETCDQAAYSLTGLILFGIANNFDGAAETALPQTFVIAFADIATQEPVGELGNFDPATGMGSVVVPNVAPGPWAVAAVCVEPTFDVDLLEAGIRESGAFLEELGAPCDINSEEFAAFVEDLLGEGADVFAFLNEFGPVFIQNIVVFEALGLQLFTVLGDPLALIDDVIADVQSLVDAGELKAGQARGLTQVLRNAIRKLEGGQTEPACSQLAAFISHASEAADDGILSSADAEDLIAQVEVIQGLLECTPANGSPSGAFLDG